MMKNEREKIDLLLEKNAAEQLTKVDWDGLNATISSRLDEAEVRKSSTRKYRSVFKIAAGVTAAAAVVFIAVMVRTDRPLDLQLENGRLSVVKFTESKGAASVEIKRIGNRALAIVSLGRGDRKVAKCDVKIIDLNDDLKKETVQASWIIISRPEPVYVDNVISRDTMGMIYLF